MSLDCFPWLTSTENQGKFQVFPYDGVLYTQRRCETCDIIKCVLAALVLTALCSPPLAGSPLQPGLLALSTAVYATSVLARWIITAVRQVVLFVRMLLQ